MVSRLTTVLLLSLLAAASGSDDFNDERVEELRAKTKSAPDGVVSFSAEEFADFALGPDRDYTLILYLTAQQLASHPELQLGKIRKEFGLLAQAYTKGPSAASNNVFFAEIVFENAQQVFHMLNAQQVPFIFRMGPEVKISEKAQKLDLPKADKLGLDGGSYEYPWKAEDIADALLTPHGLSIAKVHRPSLLKNPLLPPVAGLVAWKVYFSPVGQGRYLWCILSLLVFWFSSSGGMFNIIRKMPLYMRDRNGKIQFFLDNRGAQLGAEGFLMGAGYLGFSLALSALVFLIPHMRSKVLKFISSSSALGLLYYSGYQVMRMWQKKSGYQYVSYL